MNEHKFAEYWAQAQFCYGRGGQCPISKHLWIQLGRDWIAPADTSALQPGQEIDYGPAEQLEPSLVA